MSRSMLGWAALVFAVVVAVYALDVSLEHLEASELHGEAHELYTRGSRLLSARRPAEAVELFQRAYTLERDNREYQLSYAEALTGAGLYDEAATLLNGLIGRLPNDGRANLLLARLARARNDFANEAPYYHRAIYGVWQHEPATHANEVRLEWIRELAARGESKLLLGELLPLEAATQDPVVLRQVAQYFMEAGSPGRSADLYRALLTSSPNDAGLYQGLGQAEIGSGDYFAAQQAFLRAFRASPSDASIRHQMELSSALRAIDPTPRRLASQEKYERSIRILTLVHDSVTACNIVPALANNAEPLKRAVLNEAAEQVLQQAEFLWKQRPQGCAAPEVLSTLMIKLARS